MLAEWTAFKTRIESLPMLTGKLHTTALRRADGAPARDNYLIAIPSVPRRLDDNRFTAPQQPDSDRELSYDVRMVAVDADGVLLLTNALIGQIVGHALEVTGRACTPIRLVEGVEEGRVEYDRAADLYYLDVTFRFMSRRG